MVSAVYSLIRLAGLMEAPQCTSSMWHLLSGLFDRVNGVDSGEWWCQDAVSTYMYMH